MSSEGKIQLLSDALGRVYTVTNTSSQPTMSYNFDVYGARVGRTTGASTKWGFTGRVHEAYTNDLMYYRDRYYQPDSSTWTTTDSIRISWASARVPLGGRAGSAVTALALSRGGADPARIDPSNYSYVGQQPTVLVDPTGMTGCPGGLWIGGGGFGELALDAVSFGGVGLLTSYVCTSAPSTVTVLSACMFGGGDVKLPIKPRIEEPKRLRKVPKHKLFKVLGGIHIGTCHDYYCTRDFGESSAAMYQSLAFSAGEVTQYHEWNPETRQECLGWLIGVGYTELEAGAGIVACSNTIVHEQ